MISKELVKGYKATQTLLEQELKDSSARSRVLEKQMRKERQIEMRLKRQIEALGVLITESKGYEPPPEARD